jgi:hypothetical protein
MAKYLDLPPSDAFTAPSDEVANNQDLGAYVRNHGESGPGVSIAVLGRVSCTRLFNDRLSRWAAPRLFFFSVSSRVIR